MVLIQIWTGHLRRQSQGHWGHQRHLGIKGGNCLDLTCPVYILFLYCIVDIFKWNIWTGTLISCGVWREFLSFFPFCNMFCIFFFSNIMHFSWSIEVHFVALYSGSSISPLIPFTFFVLPRSACTLPFPALLGPLSSKFALACLLPWPCLLAPHFNQITTKPPSLILPRPQASTSHPLLHLHIFPHE